MKSTLRAALVAALLILSACSITDSGVAIDEIDSTVDDECEASGSEFCSGSSSAVQLELRINTSDLEPTSSVGNCASAGRKSNSNSDPSFDFTGGQDLALNRLTYCFDISGTCNEAGLESAAIVASTSIDGFNTSLVLGTCKRGRFHVQVQQRMASCADHTAPQYDINHLFCQQHRIRLSL